MGVVKQLIRGVKNILSNIFGFITRRKKKRGAAPKTVTVPRSWREGKKGSGMNLSAKEHEIIVIKHKRKIPGLKMINRILGGIWLFMNFVFSQFLLGSVGNQAQWVFIFFLGNCYFIAKYLWNSRGSDDGAKGKK